MNIPDVLDRRHVIPGLEARDKAALLGEFAHRAGVALKRDAADIGAALNAREHLGSTGVGGGIAIPHARVEGLDRPFAMFTRVEPAIDYEAIDGKRVDLAFLLLTPVNSAGEHLSLLAAISRRLRDPIVAAALRRAETAREIHEIFSTAP